MFLLDTNVVSEFRRRDRTNPKVAAWAAGVAPEDMFLSSITILELATGALLLTRRDRRQGELITDWIEQVLTAFASRILAVDADVARKCAPMHVPDPRPPHDSLIAATALLHRLTVVTRNRANFEPMNVPILNPWD